MKVNNVIASALNLIGRPDIATVVSSTNSSNDNEVKEIMNVMLYCYNAVEDELARKYFPLTAKEEKSSDDGKIYFTVFTHSPVKIKKVTADGKDVEFKLEPLYVEVNAKKVTVEYEYAPAKKAYGQNSDFGNEVSENLMASGIAAEFCLINGEIEHSQLWEERYRKLIDGVQRRLPCGKIIPPRRWV